jgi:uracil-DNA glycosylase family 4
MTDWRDKVRNPDCTLCPLHEGADFVCLMGSGPKHAKVMIVGEAPGQREDETHQAFVGPAGQFLNKALKSTLPTWRSVDRRGIVSRTRLKK